MESVDFFTISGSLIRYDSDDPLDFSKNSFDIVATDNYVVIKVEEKIYHFEISSFPIAINKEKW